MTIAAGDIAMSDLLDVAVEQGASDLHLSAALAPVLRLNGRLQPLDIQPLRAEDTERLMKQITPEDHQRRLRESGGSDFGIEFGERARFRVSVFMQKGSVGVVLRLIPSRFMSLEEIGLPPSVKDLLFKPRGLILVTGPTGSGKTTTLASMVNIINEMEDKHIITIEDPIEYYHPHKRSIITQRELNVDVPTFAEALRRGLRQDPDVFLVGEMRDLETIEAAITAAETGHIVFGTLHTTGATRTIDRMVNVFSVAQQEQIRVMLSVSVLAVISQILLRRIDTPGRIAAFEIMVATPSIQNLIRERKTYRILSDIQTGAKWGMVAMDASLMRLFKEGKINYEALMTYAADPEQVRTQLIAEGVIDQTIAATEKREGVQDVQIEDEPKKG
jgi:twitching motility protein PilT